MPKGMYKRTKRTELTSKQKWALNRKPTAQDMMLNDFMMAQTAEEKREVIEKFNELYFIFTPLTQENAHGTEEQTI
jgi:hypothetical protein